MSKESSKGFPLKSVTKDANSQLPLGSFKKAAIPCALQLNCDNTAFEAILVAASPAFTPSLGVNL